MGWKNRHPTAVGLDYRAANRQTQPDAHYANACRGGEPPRRLELEFVLPGQRVVDMESMEHAQHHAHQPSRPMKTIDAVVNPPSSGVPIMPRKPTDWMS